MNIRDRRDEVFQARITRKTKDRIDYLQAELGKKSEAFLIELLNAYEVKNPDKLSNQEFTLMMFSVKEYMDREEYSDVWKMTFLGKEIELPCPYESELSDELAHHLSVEFGCEIYRPNRYKFRHDLKLFFHQEKNSYLMHEHIVLYNGSPDWNQEIYPAKPPYTPLEIQRAKFVRSYADVEKHFGNHTDPFVLSEIRFCMATDIKSDYSLLDKLF